MIRLLFFLIALFPLTDIGKINAAKSAAKKAFLNGDYKTAASQYQYLIDSLGVREEEVMLNLAHSRFQLNDSLPALQGYQQLTASSNTSIRSTAYQQLGVLSSRAGKLEEALDQFKSALKANPANEEARYNYELVKRKLEEQQKQNEQNKDQNKKDKDQKQDQKEKNQQQDKKDQQQQQQKKDQQQDQNKKSEDKKIEEQQQQQKDQQQKDQEQEKKDKQNQLDPEKMKNMKMSEDKAKMILEAMKRNEVQYLQQNKRRATKPKDKNKPDW